MELSPRNRSPRAVALVITLAAVALLTVLVTTFFTRALLNRQISYSSTNLTKADFVAHSALDIITGEVRNEIVNTSNSVPYTGYYLPKTSTNAVPCSSGLVSGTGSLVKVSANGAFFTPGSSLGGSAFSTGTPSQNNRYFSASRWFTSAGSPRLGSNNVVPTWLFMTRENGIKTPVVADAKNPANGDYVIGRFAYCVYDIGGLLDANVAGYPAAAATNAPFKPSSVYADLSALGLSSPAGFTSWRNAASGADAANFQEWASGVARPAGTPNQAALAAAQTGYRSAMLGDNAVFSRSDLLDNPYLVGAGNLLTHFSRSLNAPTPSASSPTFALPGSVPHYRDDAKTETYDVSAGDLLLQRRFSLAKLAWLTYQGPKAGIPEKAIQDCFGLHWNSTSKQWDYVGPAGTTVQSQIKTLDDVAAESPVREPNFFELLKAGIVPGSVGRASARQTLALSDQQTRESVRDLQILRIGANFIDCVDEDNFPTTIVLNYSGLDVPVHGVEDLPYIYGLIYGRVGQISVVDATTQRMESCSLLMAPILFNPHAASSPAGGKSPAAIRVRIASGSFDKVYWQPLGSAVGTALARSVAAPESDLTNRPAIEVPASSFGVFRSNMSVIRGNNATTSTRLDSYNSTLGTSDVDVHGFHFYSYQNLPEDYIFPKLPNGDYNAGPIVTNLGNLLVVLEYQDSLDPKVWHVYDTLAGSEAFSVSGIAEGSGGKLSFGPGLVQAKARTQTTIGFAALKFDPRTTRFGVGGSSTWWTTVTKPMPDASFQGMASTLPFGSGTVTAGMGIGIYPGKWAEGNKTTWTGTDGLLITNVADTDNVTRPADAWLNGMNANLFQDYTDATRRPVILQKLFRTVGEMGYVFRDSPWKTLSFFDETSGDGALLDLFVVSEQPADTAALVNVNSRQPLTQHSLLAGSGQSSDGTSPLPNPSSLANAFQTYAFSAGAPTANLPMNLGALTKFMSSSDLAAAYDTISNPIKNRREAVIRALAGSCQTRTWNLLIDVVAQTGKYAASSTTLDQFVVEGQRRYWLSVAIDRYTGKVIDQQLEESHN